MVPETRRSILHGVAGLATLLAGCGGESSSSTNVSNSNTPVPDGPQSGSERDPATVLFRIESENPPVGIADEDQRRSHYRDRYGPRAVIDSTTRADQLTVDDGVNRSRLDSFLAETEFDAETLYLETIGVEECFRLDLCHISWQADEISTDYTRRLRPYTEECVADKRVWETRLIRIPDALNADNVNSYGSSVGTGACRQGQGGGAVGGSGAPESTGTERGTEQ
jgi:hypothetical protein